MSNRITLKSEPESALVLAGERGVSISSMSDAMQFAQIVVDSGIAPAGIQSKEQAFVAMQTGLELGFTPMRSLTAVVVVKGKPTLMGEAAVGLVRNSGMLEPGTDIELGCRKRGEGDDDIEGYCKSQRRGGRPQETTFSLADAKRARLYPAERWDREKGKMVSIPDSPWTKYTKRMLMWRAASFHCRDYWSDVTMGLRFTDEAHDMARVESVTERDITPPKESAITGPEKDPLLGAPPIETTGDWLLDLAQQDALEGEDQPALEFDPQKV